MGIYKDVRVPNHPLASTNGNITEHRLKLYDDIGKGPHSCHWCGIQVDWDKGGKTRPGALIVDHLDGNPRNNSIENLVPTCHGCNCTRVRTDIVQENEPFVWKPDRNGRFSKHRAVVRICQRESCKKEFNHMAADTRWNHGLYCSKFCMYNRYK